MGGNSSDKPFDDEPFNAGVEADEESDPKKFIEQLTGKLGQSLRKYNEEQGQPDYELEKFAINSLLSATHTSQMDVEDQKDIIKKVKEGGEKTEVDSTDNEPSEPTGDEETDVDVNVEDTTEEPEGEVSEIQIYEMDNLFVEPKKNNMFQPNSNDILDENKPCWKGYKQVGMKTKNGREVPNCVPINENEEHSNNYMIWQNLKTTPKYWSSTPVSKIVKENLDSKNINGNIDKIKTKLRETFNQEDVKTSAEPQVAPNPEIKPQVAPKTVPTPQPTRRNKPFLPKPSVDPNPKAVSEGLNLGFSDAKPQIYHKSLGETLDTIRELIKHKGYDEIEFDINDVQHIPYGKTVRIRKPLFINGVEDKKMLNAQIYRMDNGTYELNVYIS